MSNLTAENVPELSCDHEEADTRMLLHANHMSQAGFGNIIIHTPDTDVFLITIAASTEIQPNMFIRTGTKEKARTISIQRIRSSLKKRFHDQDLDLPCQAPLGIHAFTGCDTGSAFSGKGKTKPFKLMAKKKEYVELFSRLGETKYARKHPKVCLRHVRSCRG